MSRREDFRRRILHSVYDPDNWFNATHAACLAICSKFGRNNPFGEGDFLLVSDDFGDGVLRFEIDNHNILFGPIINELYGFVTREHPELILRVVVALEPDYPKNRLCIFADGILDYLDRHRMGIGSSKLPFDDLPKTNQIPFWE